MEVLYCAAVHIEPVFFDYLRAHGAFGEKGGGDARKTRAMKAAREQDLCTRSGPNRQCPAMESSCTRQRLSKVPQARIMLVPQTTDPTTRCGPKSETIRCRFGLKLLALHALV